MIEIFCTQCPDIAYIIDNKSHRTVYRNGWFSETLSSRKEKLVFVPTKKGGKMGRCGWNLWKKRRKRVSFIVQIMVTNRRAAQRKLSLMEGVKGRRVGRLTVGLWDGIENHGRQTRAAINLSLAQTSIRLCIQEYVMSRGCPPNFSSKPSTLLTRPLSLSLFLFRPFYQRYEYTYSRPERNLDLESHASANKILINRVDQNFMASCILFLWIETFPCIFCESIDFSLARWWCRKMENRSLIILKIGRNATGVASTRPIGRVFSNTLFVQLFVASKKKKKRGELL